MVESPKKAWLSNIKLTDILFGVISLFLVAYIVSAQTDTGLKFYIVRSGSMKPAINVGDVAIISGTKDGTGIQEGDVIAFHSRELNDTVIHRVIELDSQGYVTKGDANEDLDLDPVRPHEVLGIYRLRVPLLGFFFEGIKHVMQWLFGETRLGWIVVALGSGIFIVNQQRRKTVSSPAQQGEKEHK